MWQKPLVISSRWQETGALLRGGDIELAREDARRWGEVIGHVPRFQLGHLRSLAALAEWDGATDQMIADLQEALTLAEEIGLPAEQWPILARLGELYRTEGDEEQAQQVFSQAVEIGQALAATIDDEGLRAGFLAAESVRRIITSRGDQDAPR